MVGYLCPRQICSLHRDRKRSVGRSVRVFTLKKL